MFYRVLIIPAYSSEEAIDAAIAADSKGKAVAAAVADRYGVLPESVLYMIDSDGLINIVISGSEPFMTSHRTIDSMAQDISDKVRRVTSAKEGE